jgi:hypothetical protein
MRNRERDRCCGPRKKWSRHSRGTDRSKLLEQTTVLEHMSVKADRGDTNR